MKLHSLHPHVLSFGGAAVSYTHLFQKLVNQGMIQGRSNFVYRIKDTNTFVSLNLKDQYEVTPVSYTHLLKVPSSLRKFSLMYAFAESAICWYLAASRPVAAAISRIMKASITQ